MSNDIKGYQTTSAYMTTVKEGCHREDTGCNPERTREDREYDREDIGIHPESK